MGRAPGPSPPESAAHRGLALDKAEDSAPWRTGDRFRLRRRSSPFPSPPSPSRSPPSSARSGSGVLSPSALATLVPAAVAMRASKNLEAEVTAEEAASAALADAVRAGAASRPGRSPGRSWTPSSPTRRCASLNGPWPAPAPHSQHRSGWPPSVSSCPCSRTTFDPAGLRERLTALEAALGAPGSWDDPAQAAKIGAEHTRPHRRLHASSRLPPDVADLQGFAEIAEEDPNLA